MKEYLEEMINLKNRARENVGREMEHKNKLSKIERFFPDAPPEEKDQLIEEYLKISEEVLKCREEFQLIYQETKELEKKAGVSIW
jgi:hypothetical protein